MKKIVIAFLSLWILSACQSSFDHETWLNEPDKRNDMVYHMVSKYELEGMTENEIIELLGEPEQKLDEPAAEFVYYLGRAGLGVDDSLLRISFNEDGEAVSHEITSD